MKKIRYWVRNYFGFSETETNGFIIIMICMFLMLIFPFFLDKITPSKVLNHNNQEILDNLLADIDTNSSHQKQDFLVENDKPFVDNDKNYKLFYFDPNTASKVDLESLGLKHYIVKNILKYRSKGGFFKNKEKFGKVYGLSVQKYEELKPYIQITARKKKTKKYPKKKYKKEEKLLTDKTKQNRKYTSPRIVSFGINTATIEELKQIRGIGDSYAKRIIKFRDALGGFYIKEQIRETYQLPEETADELLKYITINNFNFKKINVNKADFKELKKHPYINYNLANAIIKFRKQHGSFGKIEDLQKIRILDQDTFDKLKHYLEL